jgi:hypothetical protein
MGVTGLTTLVFIVATAIQLLTDKRLTPGYWRKGSVAVVLYLAHVGVGVAALVWLMPLAHGPHAVDSMLIAFLGWVGLGVLGLIRFAPRLRGQEPAQFLLHVGWPDALCIIVLVGGVAAGLGGF